MTAPRNEKAPDPLLREANAPRSSHIADESARFQAEDEMIQSELRAESLIAEMFEDMEVSL